MKKCPHCHADTFGTSQLFVLDYFSFQECPECKHLVRNDGLRQFLMVPAMLGSVAIGGLLLSIVPEVLEPFAFLLILSLFALSMVLLPKPVKSEHEEILPPFSPDVKNDKVITVTGWNDGELRQILDGFIAENSSGRSLNQVELSKEYENGFRLTFPEDIHPSLFASLINYALYPIEFGTANRKIVVSGESTLNEAFDGIPEELFGRKAMLYVPKDDEEYDVVYLQSETGVNFANSLTENRWRRVDKPRLPLD